MIPDELRLGLITGLCRLVRGTLEIECKPGEYTLEILPQPDAIKICFLITTDAPYPAGPTTDVELSFSHRIGVIEKATTHYEIPMTHSAIDRPLVTFFSITADFPLYLTITNNTSETQKFTTTLTSVGFTSYNNFDKWFKWYLEYSKIKEVEELMRHALANRGRKSR